MCDFKIRHFYLLFHRQRYLLLPFHCECRSGVKQKHFAFWKIFRRNGYDDLLAIKMQSMNALFIVQPMIHGEFFVLVHNHPSGDPTPSEADRALTRRMREAADLMQIHLLDHVIIGRECPGAPPYFSFKEHGLI